MPQADRPSHMPRRVNDLADQIAGLLERELRNADREIARYALLTLAHRLQEETPNGLVACRARVVGAVQVIPQTTRQRLYPVALEVRELRLGKAHAVTYSR
jgi:hypothetical protein